MAWIYRISFKLFALCFVILLSSIVSISLISYQYMRAEMMKHEQVYTEQLLLKVEQYLDLYSAMAQSLLSSVDTMVEEGTEEALQSQMDHLYDSSIDYINNIYIIRPDLSVTGGNIYTKVFSEAVPARESIYNNAVKAWPETVISEPYQSKYSGYTVTVSKGLRKGHEYVVAAVDLNIRSLKGRLLELSGTDDVTLGLLSAKGQVVAWPAEGPERAGNQAQPDIGGLTVQDLLNEPYRQITVDEGGRPKFYIEKRYLERLNWVAVAELKGTRVENALDLLEHYLVYFIIFGLLVSLGASWAISRYIRKPLNSLIRIMRRMRSGNLNITIYNRRKDEFGELASAFSEMIRRIRHLIDDLNASESLKRTLEIQMLQSQINPHFLYNTLGSISNVVELGRPEQVDPIIRSLISILEYGVEDAADEVTLKEELENVKHYLYIQNIRYDCTFELELHIAPELMGMNVLRLMLQPIVENSIFHGYQGGRKKGPIRIAAYCTEKGAVIEVTDYGAGMEGADAEPWKRQSASENKPSRRQRIGLYNIHKRLQLHYGDKSGIGVRTAPGQGTTVIIRIQKGGGTGHANLNLPDRGR
ncbi:sensor histidine kinase [Paenibacillus gansuensis]|uniref:Sensor histidine kinase n=1 Tax=Paenibacillus gansuensis TaxID=306542 RepID=A0ABW5P9R7_9BACL